MIKGAIDLFLDPYLMESFGYFYSLKITTSIYFIIGIVSVILYDYYEVDCLRLEALKRAHFYGKEINGKNRLIRLITRRSKKGKFILSLSLASKNPGLMVIYLRDGFGLYNGFSGKYILLYFLLNTVLINIYWNGIIYLLIILYKWIISVF